MKIAEGPQDWVINIIGTSKLNLKKILCLDARTTNKTIKRETFPTLTCQI